MESQLRLLRSSLFLFFLFFAVRPAWEEGGRGDVVDGVGLR